jgi:hypothetical protein
MIFRLSLVTFVLNVCIVKFAFSQVQPDSTTLTFDSLMLKISANQTGYNTFSGRAKLTWDDGKAAQDFQATMRLKKDSIVWISFSGPMNVEGARALITPDTFGLINKTASEYDGHSFAYVNNWLLFPVSFTMLQQIITGERLDIKEKASTASYQDSVFVIYCENDHLLEKIWVDTRNYTISKILLKDKLLTQQISITFDSYNQFEGKPFSYHREIEVNRDGVLLKLTIDFTKIKLNENLSYPFEVSGKYKRLHEH